MYPKRYNSRLRGPVGRSDLNFGLAGSAPIAAGTTVVARGHWTMPSRAFGHLWLAVHHGDHLSIAHRTWVAVEERVECSVVHRRCSRWGGLTHLPWGATSGTATVAPGGSARGGR